jgi:transposase
MLTENLPCFKDLQFESVISTDSQIVITAVATPPTAACPLWQQPSRWVHSRYQRTVADLPLGGTDVVLRVRARKFFCRMPSCARRIFTERIGQFAERVRPVPESAVEHGAELLEQVKGR